MLKDMLKERIKFRRKYWWIADDRSYVSWFTRKEKARFEASTGFKCYRAK